MPRSLFIVGLAVLAVTHVSAAEARKDTYVYRKVGDLEIKADVLWGEKRQGPRPVVVWIHGGGLINGNRESIPAWMHDEFLPRGYVIVSIDYRLAPESKLPEIVTDVETALAWIRAAGPQLFGADPKRVAVVGSSAGGYLTLVSGCRSEPRPTVLVSLWGYGDLGAAWTFEASNQPRHSQGKLSPAEATTIWHGPIVCDSRQRKADGGAFYQSVRRSGTWAEAVSGWDPRQQTEKFLPFMPERNVTSDYPPTFIIHGDADTDVPFDSSARMAEQLEKHQVSHRLIRFPGAEHGLPKVDPAKVAEAYHASAEFVAAQFERQGP